MTMHDVPQIPGYGIQIERLKERVAFWRGDVLLAETNRAVAMYETRQQPVIYIPKSDMRVELSPPTELQTFCPFRGTATYFDLILPDERVPQAAWSYEEALAESRDIRGHIALLPTTFDRMDLGENRLRDVQSGNMVGPLVDWLMREASGEATPEDFTVALAERMRSAGIPVSRLSVLVWSLHPQIAGKHFIWEQDDGLTTFAPTYEVHDNPAFQNSPLRHVSNGLGGVRQRLTDNVAPDRYPIMRDLREKGATDYVAMPMPFSDGRRNVLTLTSDAPDGFSTAHLGLIYECASVIGRYYEVFVQRENAQALLETYVGKRSGARVLGGEIRRGDGDEIDAAIMFCDLRGSTRLEEEMPRAAYLALLNRFFETVSNAVETNDGEVLKFIGDAVLAVFPAGSDPAAAKRAALQASIEIVQTLTEPEDAQPCDCAIGLSYGRVTYGNIGSRERLDFTVIGRAANVAARLGDAGKKLGHRIVVSEDIKPACNSVVALGDLSLHNVSRPVTSYALTGPACRARA
ncbi:DUF427 domain-containing protein [Lutimaribacter marinistellae]|uniref:DUF427 domain-containing protein n=1 Tax=Lutimaribacter marinistellae TaxID=1820329 RepID=A0ABV7T9S7_9RHOB